MSTPFQKSILQKILAHLARATIRRYHPMVIGITGSVGKTSTREAIFTVLKKKYRVGSAEKNYNNEIGLPLAIVRLPHYGKNIMRWAFGLLRAAWQAYGVHAHFPEVLLLEYGVDHPGDMDYLLSIAKPHIAVVTAIGEIPVHVEFFENPEALIREKAKLAHAVLREGYVILNHDEYEVYGMKASAKAKVVTFGFEEHAEVKISNYRVQLVKRESLGDAPEGIAYKIDHGGNVVPIRLDGTFGKPQVYATAAAAAVGLLMKMNLVEISEALRGYVPPRGRMRLLKGIKNSFILDDTYNASPHAMREALETLKNLPGKRKIAVLGDMLEIGKYTESAHRTMGDIAVGCADILFTIGVRAKFIADEAMTCGIEASSRVLARDQVFSFDDSSAAGEALDPMIQEGDLILVKGSQRMRMENAVFEIMQEPERATQLLVRQEDYWKNS